MEKTSLLAEVCIPKDTTLWTPASPVPSVLPWAVASFWVLFMGMVTATAAIPIPKPQSPTRDQSCSVLLPCEAVEQGVSQVHGWPALQDVQSLLDLSRAALEYHCPPAQNLTDFPSSLAASLAGALQVAATMNLSPNVCRNWSVHPFIAHPCPEVYLHFFFFFFIFHN